MDNVVRLPEQGGVIAVPYLPIPVRWVNTVPVKREDAPCVIESLDLKARVSGIYADVSATMAIGNPNWRDLSVDLSVPMPDRAVVHGYSLDVDGQMVDGVVVPKEKARVAFETEQRIGADPGLVEAVKGNVYRTRVYPVPGGKTRTVQLRYVVPLQIEGGRSAFLDLPMPAEHVGERTVHVDVELPGCPAPKLSGLNGEQFKELGTCWSVEARESDVMPASGIRLALPELPASFSVVERDGKGALWFAVSEVAPQPAGNAPAITALTVLWDVSGSRAGVDHAAELELLRGYCQAESIGSFRLLAFGDRAEEVLAFDDAEAMLERIAAFRYDGGSDFQALSRALEGLCSDDANANEAYVLFTDGMDTLSGEAVSFPSGLRVLAVVSGADRDAESLRQACAGLAFDLAVAPKGADGLARALFCFNLLSGVEGEGVADVLGIGSGADGRYAVVGRLFSPSADISLANTGTVFALDEESVRDGSTLSHAWAAIRVAQLSPRADENADELLELGRRFGVVSPATSLLVLESLEQWLRYDIEPPASWKRMRREWKRHRRGMMRVDSEAGRARDHIRALKREWAELLEWWNSDFTVWKAERASASARGPEGEVGVLERRMMAAPSMTYGAPRMGAEGHDAFRMLEEECVMGEAFAPSAASAPMMAAAEGAPDASEAGADGGDDALPNASVEVKAWMPDADYLAALDGARSAGLESAREAYFRQRPGYAASPSFFIDCAGWFMANGEGDFGLRVLTNLAELRIEDAALLRVMAWRLREAGELERALSVLRRVLKLRPEDSQSHRDVALVLDELAREAYGAGDEDGARRLAEEAGSFYRETALTPWQRRPMAIGLFAVEEYNVLKAWAEARTWKVAPSLESLGEGLEGVLDCDLRITLAWDADETDIDIHVTEPSGEEAYFGNRRTHAGGRVSEDITDGYGPELYEIRNAEDGVYDIRAHYYASHQQTVFGPATCTLTVYTDWGRPTQRQQVTSMRLEDENEMISVGTATYGDAARRSDFADEPDKPGSEPRIVKGSSASELVAAYGNPDEGDPARPDGQLAWDLPGGRRRIALISAGKVHRLTERLPWGEEMIIVQ